MKHLKEHGQFHATNENRGALNVLLPGMSSFIQKYVITRQIPVPKLLKAFGIILVREGCPIFRRWLTPALQHELSVRRCIQGSPQRFTTS